MYESIQSRAVIGAIERAIGAVNGPGWVEPFSWLNGESDQATEEYAWLGVPPVMRKWIGERRAKQLAAEGVLIANDDYEATLEFHRRDLRRDKFGMMLQRVAQMAQRTGAHWAKLLTPLLTNGAASLATYGARSTYDGVNFFGNGHRGAQDNDIGASMAGATPTVAEVEDGLRQVFEALASFLDEEDEPANEDMTSLVIVHPAAMSGRISAAMQQYIQGSGGTRQSVLPNLISWSHWANPRLDTSSTTTCYVARADAPMKALIRQEEEGVMVGSTATGSEEEFKQNRHLYGVQASRGVGYGLWEYACRLTFS